MRNCEPGDILLSTHGHTLEYVNDKAGYLDHNVLYVTKEDGDAYPNDCTGSRTHDGYTYKNNRKPDIDHDIIKIIKPQYK